MFSKLVVPSINELCEIEKPKKPHLTLVKASELPRYTLDPPFFQWWPSTGRAREEFQRRVLFESSQVRKVNKDLVDKIADLEIKLLDFQGIGPSLENHATQVNLESDDE